jgi:hypothetical protein
MTAHERDALVEAARARLHVAMDKVNNASTTDAEYDQGLDRAYATYNRAVDRINRRYPDLPQLVHW